MKEGHVAEMEREKKEESGGTSMDSASRSRMETNFERSNYVF